MDDAAEKTEKRDVILLALEPDTLSEEQLNRVRDVVPDDKELIVTRDEDVIEAVVDEIEIAAGWFPRRLLSRASCLRWFQQWAAGADWLLRHPEAVQMDFKLTNMSGVQIGRAHV